jgi:hypothetical protein
MAATVGLTKVALTAMQNPTIERISTQDIRLLHPITFGPAKRKLEKRSALIADALRSGQIGECVARGTINELMPSDEEIQVAKTSEGSYISLQGVGRISAIKQAAETTGRVVSVEVKCFDLSALPFAASQLKAVAASYESGESVLSKTIGTLVAAGAVIGVGLLAGKLVGTL